MEEWVCPNTTGALFMRDRGNQGPGRGAAKSGLSPMIFKNPISIRGDRVCPPHYCSTTSDFQTFLREHYVMYRPNTGMGNMCSNGGRFQNWMGEWILRIWKSKFTTIGSKLSLKSSSLSFGSFDFKHSSTLDRLRIKQHITGLYGCHGRRLL